ncbi:hypothetical protein ACMBCM_06560, partial [Spiroplasma sp. K1]
MFVYICHKIWYTLIYIYTYIYIYIYIYYFMDSPAAAVKQIFFYETVSFIYIYKWILPPPL